MNYLKMDKNLFASRILMFSGILLIILALIHIVLFDHLLGGILLILFAVSTIFTAAGVSARHTWARAVAITNSLIVIVIPLPVYILSGGEKSEISLFLIVNVLITMIGIFMFLSLIWLRE
ncbi:MAG: hypothetical protein QME52_05805 [Bacteroidota bacterium]|nr:hypothetical protein [Bacteroidota bacterium]